MIGLVLWQREHKKKNKWDKLKEDFMAWKKLLMRQTGTGWCPIKETIVMDDDWWKKARVVSVDM
jgi:hypothetical protein